MRPSEYRIHEPGRQAVIDILSNPEIELASISVEVITTTHEGDDAIAEQDTGWRTVTILTRPA